MPVPEVAGWDEAALVISWVPAGAPDAAAAERFGRDLAHMHAAGAGAFGAPWPGWIAGLALGNDPGGSWPEWYAAERLLPFARRARGAGSLTAADLGLVEAVAARVGDLAGPAEPPSRIHGDCWSGNVLWSGGRGWLIDPAAHGGHRETDLAMLALFGAPFLGRILASYQETAPLAAGWRERVPLHQLHPLLVHVCLFGTSYREAVLDAARAALGHRRDDGAGGLRRGGGLRRRPAVAGPRRGCTVAWPIARVLVHSCAASQVQPERPEWNRLGYGANFIHEVPVRLR